jgi:hypothetical protein
MNNRNKTDAERPWAGLPIRTPLSEDSAGWSATLPGLDPSGRAEESFFTLNVAPERELSGFVPVLFAKTWEQAVATVAQLEEDDILAVLDQGHSPPTCFSTLFRGIPVLVPEECLDRASEKIAQREQDKNPFQPDPTREKPEDADDEDNDPYDDDDEYEEDDPFEDDDPGPEDDEDDQFDYDDEE